LVCKRWEMFGVRLLGFRDGGGGGGVAEDSKLVGC